jgi:hypothetical protein
MYTTYENVDSGRRPAVRKKGLKRGFAWSPAEDVSPAEAAEAMRWLRNRVAFESWLDDVRAGRIRRDRAA